jgi:hypothetical protein
MDATSTRRGFLQRAGTLGLAALVADALPAVARAGLLPPLPVDTDATLQAFADTVLPGRPATRTDLGAPIHPLAIAGVDDLPGGVEADALLLYHHPEVGFDRLAPAFLADLEARAAAHGGPFLTLPFGRRTAAVEDGLAFSNPSRLVWEAAAAVPFTAFCAAALIPQQTAARAGGYRVMGLPGKAPHGHRHFSYRRRLSHERTRRGSLG